MQKLELSLPLFKKQNLLCCDDIVELEIGKSMYSIENKTLDTTFLEMLQKTNERHTRCTQQASRNDFVAPKMNYVPLNPPKYALVYTIEFPVKLKILNQKSRLVNLFQNIYEKNTNSLNVR